MNPLEVDERDSMWEAEDATFRVMFRADDGVVSTYDCRSADFDEVATWAASRSSTSTHRIGVLSVDASGHRGIHWITPWRVPAVPS